MNDAHVVRQSVQLNGLRLKGPISYHLVCCKVTPNEANPKIKSNGFIVVLFYLVHLDMRCVLLLVCYDDQDKWVCYQLHGF